MNKKCFLFFLSIATLISCKYNLTFDEVYWKKYPNKRYRMSEDLVESKLLIGKSKKEVIDILTSNCKGCSDFGDSWIYYTKIEKGWLDAEIEILGIKFRDNKVMEVSIKRTY